MVDIKDTDAGKKRRAAIGFLREKYKHLPPEAFDVPPSMTDEEYEERIQRKFGPAPDHSSD